MDEINREAIKLVRQVLLEQLRRLEPLDWSAETEEHRQLIRTLLVNREEILKNGISSPDFPPPLIEELPQYRALDPNSPRYRIFQANSTLRGLIRISETGAWEKLDCPANLVRAFCGR